MNEASVEHAGLLRPTTHMPPIVLAMTQHIYSLVVLIILSFISFSCSPGLRPLPPWNVTTKESVESQNFLSGRDSLDLLIDEACSHDSIPIPPATDQLTLRALPAPLSSRENDFSMSYVHAASGEEFILVSSMRGLVQTLFCTTPGGKFLAVKTPLRKWNIGMPSVASDGKTIYFSARPPAGIKDEGDLYVGELSRNEKTIEIKNVRATSELNSPSWDAQPSLSRDEQTLYFASNRSGGEGGADIWFSTKNSGGVWGAPKNIGRSINTRCDELTPFVTDDNHTLYFSSNAHALENGYDIFFSRRSVGSWGAPYNAGAGVNSSSDELSPEITRSPAGDTVFFFSSNRPLGKEAKRQFDLYVLAHDTASLFIEKNILVAPSTFVRVEGVVTDEHANELSEAELFWYEQNNSSLIKTIAAGEDGTYSLELIRGRTYTIGAQGGNYFFDSYTFTVPLDTTIRMMRYDFRIADSATLRINFPNDEAGTPYEFTLDEDGSPTMQRWQEALDLLANNVKKHQSKIRQLVLTGHSSAAGAEEYNLALGLRRTKFIKAELVRRGINGAMITTQSAGKRELLPRQARGRCQNMGCAMPTRRLVKSCVVSILEPMSRL